MTRREQKQFNKKIKEQTSLDQIEVNDRLRPIRFNMRPLSSHIGSQQFVQSPGRRTGVLMKDPLDTLKKRPNDRTAKNSAQNSMTSRPPTAEEISRLTSAQEARWVNTSVVEDQMDVPEEISPIRPPRPANLPPSRPPTGDEWEF